MRDSLIIGLLLAMPVTLILALAALASLAGRLRRQPQQELNGCLQRPDMTPTEMDPPTTVRPGRHAATLR
jgi:hypothetical protein